MRTKLLCIIASTVIGSFASIGIAKADTYVTYNVFGSFADDEYDPPGPALPSTPIPLGGTLYIDVTTGSVVSSDLLIPGGLFAPLNITGSQYTSPNGTGLLYEVNFSNAGGDFGYIDFIYPNDPTNPLIGHPLIYLDQGEFNTPSGFIPFGLTGSIQATPLPASLPLLASGFGALGLLSWRWKRKNTAAVAV